MIGHGTYLRKTEKAFDILSWKWNLVLLIVKRHKIAHLILYRTNQTVQLDRRYFLFSKRVVEIFSWPCCHWLQKSFNRSSYSRIGIPIRFKFRMVNIKHWVKMVTSCDTRAQCLYNQHWRTEIHKEKNKRTEKWNFAVNVLVEIKDKTAQQLARELKEAVLVMLTDVAN